MIWFPIILFAALVTGGCLMIPGERRFSVFFFRSLIAVLVAFAAAFSYKFLSGFIQLNDSVKVLFYHYLVHDHLYFYFIGIITVFIMAAGYRNESFSGILYRTFVFMAVFMFVGVMAKFYYSIHGHWADPYLIFMLPAAMLLQCVIAALFTACFYKGTVAMKIPVLILMLAVPFETAAVSALYYSFHRIQSLVLLAGLIIVFTAIFFLAARKAESKA